MKIKKIYILFLIWSAALRPAMGAVDTVQVNSPSMHTSILNLVVTPDTYTRENSRSYPVLYLLHGHGGNQDYWLSLKPELPQLATQMGMIIVCPDGKNSWYWDSPVDTTSRYETYIVRELIPHIDRHYRTISCKSGRAITGNSMGGHGALWLAIRHQDMFGACGSTSGGVDIRPFPDNWEMSRWLGRRDENLAIWETHTVFNLSPLIQKNALAIIIDCGTEDFFYKVNEAFHRRLLSEHIDHDYLTRPGAHNGRYWINSIDYQLLFFCKFFNRNQ